MGLFLNLGRIFYVEGVFIVLFAGSGSSKGVGIPCGQLSSVTGGSGVGI